MEQFKIINKQRFLRPPTIEEIDEVISKSGASSPKHFEQYYGIYRGCIAQVRCGFRKLPTKYWHIFLTPSKPTPVKVSNFISKPKFKTSASSKKINPTEKLKNLLS